MTKVYPNAASTGSEIVNYFSNSSSSSSSSSDHHHQIHQKKNKSVELLTVWKKSLLLNCDGFTVFDNKGDLVYRVDNYSARNKSEIVLMDASGKSLLTIRRKRMSLADNWLVFEGETTTNPILSARKHVNLLNSKSIAHVSQGGGVGGSSSSSSRNRNSMVYEIEGSYSQRSCGVYDEKRRRVAEIRRKEGMGGMAFGFDVFRLVVHPEMDAALAMALVILLDQMFGSPKR